MGVDPSIGGDEMVATLAVDRVVTDIRRWRNSDLMASTGVTINLAREWNVAWPNVHIDRGGLGAGLVARAQEQGCDVDGVDFGASPRGAWSGIHMDTRFVNQRVELYHTTRRLLMDRQFAIPARFIDTRVDLAAVQMMAPDSSGACRLEPKDAVKKRLGRSPDCGDSAVLCLARKSSSVGVRWL